jgi:hypothetical protein
MLDDSDMANIAMLNRNLRLTTGALWTMDGSPYTMEYLWEN